MTVPGQLAAELEAMLERLDEIEDWAQADGLSAVAHKLQEAMTPLASAAAAARQYDDGTLSVASP